MANVTAVIITIGDELLIGQTVDTNSAWMSQQLNEIGVSVERIVTVPDTKEALKSALDTYLNGADVILMTGGLGPTADDITKPFLCEYFGGKMVVNVDVLSHVAELFRVRNKPVLERNKKQAEVPDVCTVLKNEMGTAPGMLFEKGGKYLISMPGVPFEMMSIMQQEVIPFLSEKLITGEIYHRTIITSGEGESFIADMVADIESQLPPFLKLAYLPSPGVVRLRLTAKGDNGDILTQALDKYYNMLVERVQYIIISLEDKPVQEVLADLLKKYHLTISLAESCTGGYIAHLITQVQGSSEYFRGAIVPYQSDLKSKIVDVDKEDLKEHSAISKPVAEQLATNVRKMFQSDYSLSVSGQLSHGGEDAHVPKGEVWMSVASDKEVKTKKFQFHYNRLINKEMSAQIGMLMLLKAIKKDKEK